MAMRAPVVADRVDDRSRTMRAAVFHGTGRPLEIEDIARPVPGPGEVVVTVAGCGLCHTDLHYLDHGVPTAHPPPIVLGHEISGRIARTGPGAESWSPGTPVLLPAVLPCGECAWCRTGRENICPKLRMFGNHIDGGFAEEVLAPARDLIRLPESLDLVTASVIADAVSTPYHAIVHRAQVRAGEWVAVVGCGGVGMNAVQLAALSGANVIAIDLRPEKLAMARELGATATLRPTTDEELIGSVRRLAHGGVDVAVEAIGRPSTIGLALGLLRRGGRLCLIGYSEAPANLPVGRLMFFEQSVIGSLGCRPADYPKIVELVVAGRIRLEPIVTARVPLAQIGAAAERLRRGDGLRTVIVPG